MRIDLVRFNVCIIICIKLTQQNIEQNEYIERNPNEVLCYAAILCNKTLQGIEEVTVMLCALFNGTAK